MLSSRQIAEQFQSNPKSIYNNRYNLFIGPIKSYMGRVVGVKPNNYDENKLFFLNEKSGYNKSFIIDDTPKFKLCDVQDIDDADDTEIDDDENPRVTGGKNYRKSRKSKKSRKSRKSRKYKKSRKSRK